MYILLISYPYSWCYIPPAGAHTDPKAGGFILVVVLQEIISIWSCLVGGNVRLMVMGSSSSLQILLGLSFMICYMLLHLVFSSLD